MVMEIIIWLENSLKVIGSAFVKNLNANNAIASLFKSSIGKIDRFLKIGRVWSLGSENEIALTIFFCSFLIDYNLEG